MDPATIGLGAAGLISGFLNKSDAQNASSENLDFQRQNAQQQLAFAREALAKQLAFAKAGRTDQFGNRTTFNDATNEWDINLTPAQRALLDRSQVNQAGTLARGAQAGEDYSQARRKLLYERPPSEIATRDELNKLIAQSRGEGDRALNTLVNRQELRQKGNLPVINTGINLNPAPGQRLADQMLQARKQALDETTARTQAHEQTYLPEMQSFERTANTMMPSSDIGAGVVGQATDASHMIAQALQSGNAGIGQAFQSGGQGINAASALSEKAATSGPKLGEFAALIRSINNPTGSRAKGTLGNTTGATFGGDNSNDFFTPAQRKAAASPTVDPWSTGSAPIAQDPWNSW